MDDHKRGFEHLAGGRKIIFVNRFFFPDESATAQIVTDLAEHLCARGLSVWVVTSNASLHGSGPLPRFETVLGGVRVRRVPQTGGRTHSIFGKLIQLICFYPLAFAELLRTVSPGDLVVAKTDPPLISIVALLAAKLRRAQLINWLQDLYPEVAARLDTPVVTGLVGRWLGRLRNVSLRGAVVNVAIGRRMAETLRAEGVPPEKVQVIPNWADEEALRAIEPSESRARKAWELPLGDFVLGYSGNLGRAHESETLLAAARILANRAEIKFLFIGGGHEFSRLESVVRKEGLSNFIFKPHQPREQLQDTLAAADAHWLSLRPELEGLIVPSKFYGILAAGRPVVAVTAPNGEIGEIVRNENVGFAIQPGDGAALAEAIIILADDSRLRRSMGQRARRLSETLFARKAALQSWTALIRSSAASEEQARSQHLEAVSGQGACATGISDNSGLKAE